MLVAPDTSPRGANVPGEDESWDLGTGAGFYLDATMPAWSRHYRMDSYVTRELPIATGGELPGDAGRAGIFGHSMGGHGALVLALRNPGKYRSVSAFAPIAAPSRCPWGKKAFGAYLGDDVQAWAAYDASALMARLRQPFPAASWSIRARPISSWPNSCIPGFRSRLRRAGQPLTLRRHEGYDHGYYFISTFIEDHIRFHVEQLGKPAA